MSRDINWPDRELSRETPHLILRAVQLTVILRYSNGNPFIFLLELF